MGNGLSDKEISIIMLFFVGFLIAGFLAGYFITSSSNLSQETLNDICVNFTGNSTAEGHVKSGKLICETPSFDSTQNIIVRSNDGGGGNG